MLMHILCLGYRLICFAAKGAQTKHRWSSLPSRSFAIELSPSLLPTASPPSTLSSLPSHSFPRSPQAISHGFPSVHLIVTSISLAPSQRCSPNLFPTPSSPSTLSSLPSRSFRTELSPSYFLRFPLRPPYRRFHLAPSQRSSPQSISHVLGEATAVMRDVALLACKGRTVRAMTRLCDSCHSILITTQRFNATCIFKLELARKPQLSLKRSFKALAHQIKKTWGHWWRTPAGCAGP